MMGCPRVAERYVQSKVISIGSPETDVEVAYLGHDNTQFVPQ